MCAAVANLQKNPFGRHRDGGVCRFEARASLPVKSKFIIDLSPLVFFGNRYSAAGADQGGADGDNDLTGAFRKWVQRIIKAILID